jgi:inorganic pyrophosphatase
MNKLINLPCWDENKQLNVVVESPKGSGIKFKYEPKLGVFTVARAFPLGVSYPFDWGFIPGTRDEDGDPIDVLVLHNAATYPGVLLPCEIIGMIAISQKVDGKYECNNRIIAKPMWDDSLGQLANAANLPHKIRKELEQFFLSTTFFTSKKIKIEGWKNAKVATKFVNSHQKRN